MQAVVDFLRAIVEALPWDQMKNLVPSGRATMPENVAHSTVQLFYQINTMMSGIVFLHISCAAVWDQ